MTFSLEQQDKHEAYKRKERCERVLHGGRRPPSVASMANLLNNVSPQFHVSPSPSEVEVKVHLGQVCDRGRPVSKISHAEISTRGLLTYHF